LIRERGGGSELGWSRYRALTGARIEEIATLKVSDVDLKAMTLHLPGTKTEAAERTIPFHPALKATFQGRMKGKDKATWVCSISYPSARTATPRAGQPSSARLSHATEGAPESMLRWTVSAVH